MRDELIDLASVMLDIPEKQITKIKVRYKAGNGSLIKEDVYVNQNDVIALYGIEDVTKHLKKPTKGYVEVFVPSRIGVRRFSAYAGKSLTVID